MSSKWQDAEVPLVYAPSKFCPRKLTNKAGEPNVKRYLHFPRALGGYMVACPSCAFVAMFMQPGCAFEEDGEGILTKIGKPPYCIVCGRVISVALVDGVAVLRAALPVRPSLPA